MESPFAEVLQEHQRVLLKINRASAGLVRPMVFNLSSSPVKEKGEPGPGRRRKMSQQESKRVRVKQPSIDETPFQILGVHTPFSPQEYEATIERVMVILKRMLCVSILSG
jgi:hypothetical protein